MKEKFRKIAKIILILGLAMLAITLGGYLLGFRLINEKSMPRGVYREVSGNITKGDMAFIRLPYKWSRFGLERGYVLYNNDGSSERDSLKHIAASEGDEIAISKNGITVNGVLLPKTAQQENDSHGRPMPGLTIEKIVLEKGQFIAVSHEMEKGFDSRYYGILNASNLKSKAVKIFTEN